MTSRILSKPSLRNSKIALRAQQSTKACTSHPTKVLITGGSRGIGLSIAHAFASKQNHVVTILGRDKFRLQAACQEIRTGLHQIDNVVINAIQADVSDPRIWNGKSFVNVGGDGGDVPLDFDVLVNAAGVAHSSLLSAMSTDASSRDGDRGEVEKIIGTNLVGTIYSCRAMTKVMLRSTIQRKRNDEDDGRVRSSPCIINISSLLGLQGGIGASVYAASKAGVLGLTRALAAELGPLGIRVNAIVPGYIDTAMTEFCQEKTRATASNSFRIRFLSQLLFATYALQQEIEANLEREAMDAKAHAQALGLIPLKRFGKPEEIAEAALFLVGNEYANNCVINLDGGLSAAL